MPAGERRVNEREEGGEVSFALMPVEPPDTQCAAEGDAAAPGVTPVTTRLRVGIVHYLNSWPLAWSFLSAAAPAGTEPIFLAPAKVADGLAAGELEVGLVPSAELQRIPGLAVVPGLCIASQHEVKSVLLVSRVPPAQIRRVALDESSRTSAVLVQLLLAERFGVRPEVAPFRPDLAAMLATADAALLIGDPALRVDRAGLHVVDLAAEWRALTGLPFVFAVWAVAPGAEARMAPGAISALFAASLAAAERDLDRLVEAASAQLRLLPGDVYTYLTQHLSYRLGPAERTSLDEFFRRAHRHGLLPAPRPLRYLEG
jgi:chorismate dehydratase